MPLCLYFTCVSTISELFHTLPLLMMGKTQQKVSPIFLKHVCITQRFHPN